MNPMYRVLLDFEFIFLVKKIQKNIIIYEEEASKVIQDEFWCVMY